MNEFMDKIIRTALEKAGKSGKKGEIPVCAVIFDSKTGKTIASGVNATEKNADPTAHAEIIAIRKACKALGVPRLPEYDMYVTLEPCPMCAAAISFARLRRVYFGAYDAKGGGIEHTCRLYDQPGCLHRPEVYGGFGETESARMLKDFFRTLRKEKP